MKRDIITIWLIVIVVILVGGCSSHQSNNSGRNSNEYSSSKNKDIPTGIFNEAITVKKASKKYFYYCLNVEEYRAAEKEWKIAYKEMLDKAETFEELEYVCDSDPLCDELGKEACEKWFATAKTPKQFKIMFWSIPSKFGMRDQIIEGWEGICRQRLMKANTLEEIKVIRRAAHPFRKVRREARRKAYEFKIMKERGY